MVFSTSLGPCSSSISPHGELTSKSTPSLTRPTARCHRSLSVPRPKSQEKEPPWLDCGHGDSETQLRKVALCVCVCACARPEADGWGLEGCSSQRKKGSLHGPVSPPQGMSLENLHFVSFCDDFDTHCWSPCQIPGILSPYLCVIHIAQGFCVP